MKIYFLRGCMIALSLLVSTVPALSQTRWTDAGDHIFADNAPAVVVTDAGEVGVGTTDPQAKLHVKGSLHLNLGEGLLLRSDGDYWGTHLDARLIRMIDGNGTNTNVDGGLVFETYTSSDDRRAPILTLRRKGGKTRVGLGAAFPSNPLMVQGALGNGAGTLDSLGTTVFGNGTSFLSQVVVGSEIIAAGQVRRVTDIVNDQQLTLNVAFPSDLLGEPYRFALPLFVVNDAGEVGLGTSDPQTLLTLRGDDFHLLELDRTVRQEVDHRFFLGPSWGTDDVDHLGFHTDGPAGTNMMVIKSTGQVGIGTARPASKLVVTHNDFGGAASWAASIDSTTSDATSAVLHLRNSSARSVLFARGDGNVGIGTETPTAKLDVSGALAVSGAIDAGGALAVGGATVIDASGEWVGTVPGVDLTSDQTVAGTKTFTRRIHAQNGLKSLDTLQVGDPTIGDLVEIYTAGRALNLHRVGGLRFGEISTNPANDFILEAPSGKLRSGDDLYLRFSDTSNWRDLFAGAVTVHEKLAVADRQGSAVGTFAASAHHTVFDDEAGGDLQIRTKLHVTGRSDTYMTFGTSNSSRILFEEGAFQERDLDVHLGSADNGKLRLFGNMEVGGSVHALSGVEIWGNLVFHPLPSGASSGQVCFVDTLTGDFLVKCSSSQRYKENITPFTSGLKAVRELRPVAYDWKGTGGRDLGFLAEEVAEVDPLLVTRDGGRVDGVKYDRMTALLVNAIQEQQAQIEQLKAIVCLDHPEMEGCDGPRP